MVTTDLITVFLFLKSVPYYLKRKSEHLSKHIRPSNTYPQSIKLPHFRCFWSVLCTLTTHWNSMHTHFTSFFSLYCSSLPNLSCLSSTSAHCHLSLDFLSGYNSFSLYPLYHFLHVFMDLVVRCSHTSSKHLSVFYVFQRLIIEQRVTQSHYLHEFLYILVWNR